MTSQAPVLVGVLAVILFCAIAAAINGDQVGLGHVQVRKESRKTLALTESGKITAVDVRDASRGAHYHLQFITMEPGSLFLPVLLHTDMLFYVHTGKGTVTRINEDGETEETVVERGDVYRLEQGTTFYMKSHPDPRRHKFRIYAIFDHIDIDNPLGYAVGPYASISDIVRGFHEDVLQMGLGVSEETIGRIKRVLASPSIVPFTKADAKGEASWTEEIIGSLFGVRGSTDTMNKKERKKTMTTKNKAYNFLKAKPDVQNSYGWSTALTHDDFKALQGSNLAPFMVNLTRGCMMGPHWNPRATEIAIVIRGRGVVQVVCPSDPSGAGDGSRCQNMMFKVGQGDVFVVPRFHPMTQISYNDDTFVFVGFSSVARNNHPQFLAGKRSVLQVIDASILAASLNLPNTSKIEELLASQSESIMFACTSCAEDLERKMEEEMGRREEKEEEEEERKREEAAARKREEEEEARKKEEEEAREREEEERMREEEEEARRREEEEETRRREEAAAATRREEAAAKKREEEEARRRKEETEEREEEAKRREEEEEEARRIAEEEEEARRRERAETGWREEEEEEEEP